MYELRNSMHMDMQIHVLRLNQVVLLYCLIGPPKVSDCLQPRDVQIPVLLPHEILDAVARAGSEQAGDNCLAVGDTDD